MAITQQRMSVEQFLAQPEEEPALELEPDGTVTQKVSPRGQHSRLQPAFAEQFNRFAEPRKLALAFTELRATFGGASYVPDVSVYLWDRIPITTEGEVADDFREPPDIAVKIVSPEQSVNAPVRRCMWNVEHGVGAALLVDPKDRSVLLFRPGGGMRALSGGDSLELADILPGFQLTVEEIFASLRIR
jgi:Uma2 family endonuclease